MTNAFVGLDEDVPSGPVVSLGTVGGTPGVEMTSYFLGREVNALVTSTVPFYRIHSCLFDPGVGDGVGGGFFG